MALKIRLRPQGRNNRAFYRVVVTDSRSPSDGKYVEALGWYDPMANEAEKSISLDTERVRHWLGLGAELTERTESLVRKAAPEVIREATQREVAKREKARLKRRALAKKA
jgi:small subunit ribosomal protein S16